MDSLRYRRVRGDSTEAHRALVDLDAIPAERFPLDELGSSPWVLAAGDEAAVLRAAAEDSEPLESVTSQVFQGAITSADAVYVLEDRGWVGGARLVYSRALDRELELEGQLLHPLASGGDVKPYAFDALSRLLLFPYASDDGGGRLVTQDELARLPNTHAYLRDNEEILRGRESGRVDHDGWYGYVYPKNLTAHDQPKLGIPRLCDRLRASFDVEEGST